MLETICDEISPRVSSRSLASVDVGFVEISSVQLSQSGVQKYDCYSIGNETDYKIKEPCTYRAMKRLFCP